MHTCIQDSDYSKSLLEVISPDCSQSASYTTNGTRNAKVTKPELTFVLSHTIQIQATNQKPLYQRINDKWYDKYNAGGASRLIDARAGLGVDKYIH